MKKVTQGDEYQNFLLKKNFKLIQGDGNSLPVDSNSLDIVYSFIVFQHFGKINRFKLYTQEVYRVLKPGSYAVIYTGRYCPFSFNKSSAIRVVLDSIAELTLKNGYKEIDPKLGTDNSLLISKRFALNNFKKQGFEILDTWISARKVPDGGHCYGGQHGFLLKK